MKRISILYVAFISLILFSCNKEKEGYMGDHLVAASEGFQVEEVEPGHKFLIENYKVKFPISSVQSVFLNPSNNATMTTGYGGFKPGVPDIRIYKNGEYHAYFRAKFNSVVSWTITVRDTTSGYVGILHGTSDKIDSTNCKFYGLSSNNILHPGDATSATTAGFSDLTYATLCILGSDEKFTIPFKWIRIDDVSVSNLGRRQSVYNPNIYYFLIDDFDNQTNTDRKLSQSYQDPLDKDIVKTPNYTAVYSNMLANSTDGNEPGRSLYLKGYDVNNNAYIVGYNTYSLASFMDTAANQSAIQTTNPDSLYVNMMVYGYNPAKKSTIQIKLYEMDNPNDYIPNYLYDDITQKSNDAYTYDLTVTWTGWKFVSVPYSWFKRARDINLGGNGNGQKEPNRVTGMAVTLISLEGYPEGEVNIDCVYFSENGPMILR